MLVEGEMLKEVPQALHTDTVYSDSSSYPEYRRRSPEDGGIVLKSHGEVIDNQFEVRNICSNTFTRATIGL